MDIDLISRDSLERAARALVGDQGVNVIVELAQLLDDAEARGYARGRDQALMNSAEWTSAYQKGYDDAIKDGSWVDWPAETPDLSAIEVDEADIRDPIVNAHVEGAVWPDMTEYHVENRSPISDAEAYEALEQMYGYAHE